MGRFLRTRGIVVGGHSYRCLSARESFASFGVVDADFFEAAAVAVGSYITDQYITCNLQEMQKNEHTGLEYCSAERSSEEVGEPCRCVECSFVPSGQASAAAAVKVDFGVAL